MAPITWRNVDAPDFEKAARIMQGAVSNMGGAADGIGDAFKDVGALRRRTASAEALPVLARVANEQGVDAALSQVEGQVAPHLRSQELLDAMMGLRNSSQGYERNRAVTGSLRAGENRTQTTFDRNIRREDALAGQTNDWANARLGAYANGELEQRWIRQESGGNPNAVSPAGAVGLTQIMPATARDPGYGLPNIFQLARTAGLEVPDESDATLQRLLRHEDVNLAFGRAYRDKMIEINGGDVSLGMAAYNAGQGRVDDAGGRVPNIAETQNYVRNIVGGMPADYDFSAGGVLRPGDINPMIDDTYGAFNTARANADADRDRDTEFADGRQNRAEQRAAADLALQQAIAGLSPTESVQGIGRAAPNGTVAAQAFGALGNLPVSDLQALPFDAQFADAPAEAGKAQVARASARAEKEGALSDDLYIRILSEAERTYTSEEGTSPAVKLNDVFEISDENRGITVRSVNRVAQALDVSEAEAASLLARTAERGTFWNFVDGTNSTEVKFDVNNAIELGREYKKNRGVAAETRALGERHLGEIDRIESQMATLQQRMLAESARGNDISTYEKKYADLVQESLAIQGKQPTGGRPQATPAPTPAPAQPRPVPPSVQPPSVPPTMNSAGSDALARAAAEQQAPEQAVIEEVIASLSEQEWRVFRKLPPAMQQQFIKNKLAERAETSGR